VNESLPAPSQRTGFDSTQIKKVLEELDLLDKRIKTNGNHLLWTDLYRLEAKVNLFLHFLQIEDFDKIYRKFNESLSSYKSSPFEKYRDELMKKAWYKNNSKISDRLGYYWEKYIKEINARNSTRSTSEFITEWTTILKRIQALIIEEQTKFKRERIPNR
jgi:hypothetical protein